MSTVQQTGPPDRLDHTRLQTRVLAVLSVSQIIGALGVAAGITIGALVIAELSGGPQLSGLASSAMVFGSAMLALPAAAISTSRGRRNGLMFGLLLASLGAGLVVVAIPLRSVPLALIGMLLFGGATTTNLQARYAATDLAPPDHRARHLSLVMWTTTVGAVVGPLLMPATDRLAIRSGLSPYVGPFVLSCAAFLFAALLLLLLLRPDPLTTARQSTVSPGGAEQHLTRHSRLRTLFTEPQTLLGVVTMSVGHVVMVSVMSMTPVQIAAGAHAHGSHAPTNTIALVAIVMTFHVAGMFALAPIFGWATDRIGLRPVVGISVVLLIAACVLAAVSSQHTVGIGVAMVLLGLGWSGTMVAGSALVVKAVPIDRRANVQGTADFIMSMAGGTAGAISGVLVAVLAYSGFALVMALAVVPLLVLLRRTNRAPALNPIA